KRSLPQMFRARASARACREPSRPSPPAFGAGAVSSPTSARSSSACRSRSAASTRSSGAPAPPCASRSNGLAMRFAAPPSSASIQTGWKQAGEKRFLWGAFTAEAAALRVAPARHREEAEDLLGATEAIVCSDRWWAYDHLDPARRQLCWSQLQRDFRYHAESPLAHQ